MTPVVGVLNPGSVETSLELALTRGLADVGYFDGRNVRVENHWAKGDYDRMPSMAAELVRRNVAVIGAPTTPAALAAKNATATIPIVFAIGADPVKLGLVATLNWPGANVTGVTVLSNVVEVKKLELLHQLVPSATVVGVLVNPANPNAVLDAQSVQVAAASLGVRIVLLNAQTADQIEAAIGTLRERRGGALLVTSDAAAFNPATSQLVTLAARYALPAIYDNRAFVITGGLVSYGADFEEGRRQSGVYIGRILKGEKPAELPVQQSSKFETVLNLKVARALGIEVPTSLLLRADEVIE